MYNKFSDMKILNYLKQKCSELNIKDIDLVLSSLYCLNFDLVIGHVHRFIVEEKEIAKI